ncbi:MAG: IS110 family transposase [Deltaproteobacteria bacterium]
MEYCGMDVHQKYSEVCLLDEGGEVVERARIRTSRSGLGRYFSAKNKMKVVLEAGGSSPWVSRLVESCGHEVVVCSPRRVRLIAESTLKNDRIDAEVLARLVRIDPGFLGRVQQRSERAQVLRSKLTVRSRLVTTRTKWINTVKGILRALGYTVPGGASRTFCYRVRSVELPEELATTIEPLLRQLDAVNEEIIRCEKELRNIASAMPEVMHLQEVPGVGLIVSLYFVLTVDDPYRFRKSRDIPAFFGLRPKMRSSGDVSTYGRISKQGDPEMRRLLIQAAHALMQCRTPCALQDWATKVVQRRGYAKAMVALARKLGVVMHHLWVTGEVFERYPSKKAA